VPYVRDLGITIDSKLSFNEHIDDIASKSSRQVYHLIKALPRLTPNLYVRLYNAYVLPILEYGSVIFNPTQKGQIERLEKPQRLFTKILSRRLIPDSDYTGRLKVLRMHSLEYRRTMLDLIHVFKILFGFINIESSQFFSFPKRVNNRLSHGLRLNHPRTPDSFHAVLFQFGTISPSVSKMFTMIAGMVPSPQSLPQTSLKVGLIRYQNMY
jgi:hypothetical protein